MSGKRWGALILAIGLFFISITYQFAISGSTESYENLLSESYFEEKVIKEGTLFSSKIAVINLQGIIQDLGDMPFMSSYSHQHLLRMIEKAGEDDNVEGIILKVNTPGGGVVESAEIHDKLVEIRELYDKPIYASMGNTAASGGYYVSAPTDKIIAHPATITGSIGVIMENINFAELADKYGIDFNTIKSGEFKDIMSSSRPMTSEEEEILQSIIDELYEDFVQVIVDGRDMSYDQVKKLADGRIYSGRQAQALGLVDELGDLHDTIAMMEEDFDLSGAQVIQYEISFGLGQLFGFSAQSLFKKDSELLGIMNILRQSEGPRAMYLYSR